VVILFIWLIMHKGSYPKAPLFFFQLPDYSLNCLVLKLHGSIVFGHVSAKNLSHFGDERRAVQKGTYKAWVSVCPLLWLDSN
jgi:hypothetical protein